MPSRFVEVAESAFAWHLVDTEQTALSDESLVEIPLAVPGCAEQSGVREFVFAGWDFTIQVSVSATSLLGRVVPPQRGDMEVYERGGFPHIFKVDDQGGSPPHVPASPAGCSTVGKVPARSPSS